MLLLFFSKAGQSSLSYCSDSCLPKEFIPKRLRVPKGTDSVKLSFNSRTSNFFDLTETSLMRPLLGILKCALDDEAKMLWTQTSGRKDAEQEETSVLVQETAHCQEHIPGPTNEPAEFS